ncbi:unnamed protein product, partial [Brassica oleracea var. botrytis]
MADPASSLPDLARGRGGGLSRQPLQLRRGSQEPSLGLAPHHLRVVAVGVVSTDRESSRHLLLKTAGVI